MEHFFWVRLKQKCDFQIKTKFEQNLNPRFCCNLAGVDSGKLGKNLPIG